MTESIHIGGEMRPVRFGLAALLKYEQETGRKALADFAEFGTGAVSITVMVDMVYYGLACGYQKATKIMDFDKYDVADWIGQDPAVFEKAMLAFSAAFPSSEGNAKAAPKVKLPVPQA